MLFHTPSFALFFMIIFALYWMVSPKYRLQILLAAGYVFYAFSGWQYLLLLVYVTLVSRVGTLALSRDSRPDHPPKWKTVSLCFMLLVPLVVYKVLGFFDAMILIPIGLSFYTFEAVGFLLDVDQGRVSPAENLWEHALFLSFFPQLLSGPIARAGRLIPQFSSLHAFDAELAAHGVRLFLWGLFKKAALADTLSSMAEPVFASPGNYSGFALLCAACLFSLEIYCDFSGYSDMALGVAALLGIRLDVNFRQPYFASSIRDFWRRWHISLSTWLRDYIYIPLGGNRRGKLRRDVNLLITFFISGLWHGSGVTFLVWGLFHGVLQVVELGLADCWHRIEALGGGVYKKASPILMRIGRAFLRVLKSALVFIAVTAGWVVFHAHNLSDAFRILMHWADGMAAPVAWIREGLGVFTDKTVFCVMLVVLFIGEILLESGKAEQLLKKLPRYARVALTVVFLLFIWGMLPFRANHQFLYFAF